MNTELINTLANIIHYSPARRAIEFYNCKIIANNNSIELIFVPVYDGLIFDEHNPTIDSALAELNLSFYNTFYRDWRAMVGLSIGCLEHYLDNNNFDYTTTYEKNKAKVLINV